MATLPFVVTIVIWRARSRTMTQQHNLPSAILGTALGLNACVAETEVDQLDNQDHELIGDA